MSAIRLMHPRDADPVRHVDSVAFGPWARQVYGDQAPVYRRTLAHVLLCWEKDPEGCFVAVEDGRVVGFIFSRTWGRVGWFGTFAVLPEYQGRGLGKRLIRASLDYLSRDTDRVIGLETMPESPYNLGLYLKLGFQTSFPTFLMTKALDRSVTPQIRLPRWAATDSRTQERWLGDLQQATGEIRLKLDYSKEILSTAQHGFGETLILVDGQRARGLSVVWLTSGWEGLGEERASVQVLALHPAYTNAQSFSTLLDATEALAWAHDKSTVGIGVNAQHRWALEQLLAQGYRVSRTTVRMLLRGMDAKPSPGALVDCSRWAG